MRPSSRHPERGSAMIVTMIVVASLLAGATVLVAMQLASTRSSDLSRSGLSSMYCAEAGLSAARPVVAGGYTNWATSLANYSSMQLVPTDTTSEQTYHAWLWTGIGGVTGHDLDGDGVADFTVYIKDNEDEIAPNANDYTKDNDLRVWIVSTCIKYTDTPQQVEELVTYSGGGNCYQAQLGGCGGNGNQN